VSTQAALSNGVGFVAQLGIVIDIVVKLQIKQPIASPKLFFGTTFQ
jgi:hypothetical protein